MLDKNKVLAAIEELFDEAEKHEDDIRVCTIEVSNEGLDVLYWHGAVLNANMMMLELGED